MLILKTVIIVLLIGLCASQKTCAKNETSTLCPGCEHTCEGRPKLPCICKSGCGCAKGFLMSKVLGHCIKKEDCPKKDSTIIASPLPSCKYENEHFRTCALAAPTGFLVKCEKQCGKGRLPLVPTCFCTPRCVCKGGYERDSITGNCVKAEFCPPKIKEKRSLTCGDKEEWGLCASCHRTCQRSHFRCLCTPGCKCKSPYVRDEITGNCMLKSFCPVARGEHVHSLMDSIEIRLGRQKNILGNYKDSIVDLIKANGNLTETIINQQITQLEDVGIFNRNLTRRVFNEAAINVHITIKQYLATIHQAYAHISEIQCRQIELLENIFVYTTNSIYTVASETINMITGRTNKVLTWLNNYRKLLMDEYSDMGIKTISINLNITSALKGYTDTILNIVLKRRSEVQKSIEKIVKNTIGEILEGNMDSIELVKKEIGIMQKTFQDILGTAKIGIVDLIIQLQFSIHDLSKLPFKAIGEIQTDVSAATSKVTDVFSSGVKDPIGTLVGNSESAIAGLKTTAEKGIENLKVAITESLQGLTTIPTKISTTLNTIMNTAKNGLNSAKNVAVNQSTVTANTIQVQLGTAIDLSKGMIGVIEKILTTSVADTVHSIKAETNVYLNSLKFYINSLKNISLEGSDKIQVAVMEPIDLTIHSVSLVNAKAAETMRHTVANLIYTTTEAVNHLGMGLKASLSLSTGSLKDVSKAIAHNVKITLNSAQGAVKNVVGTSANAVKSTPDLIKTEIDNSQQFVKDAVKGTQEQATSIKNTILNTAKNFIDHPIESVQNLPIKELDAVSATIEKGKRGFKKTTTDIRNVLGKNLDHINNHYDDTKDTIVGEIGNVLDIIDDGVNATKKDVYKGILDQVYYTGGFANYYLDTIKHLSSLERSEFHSSAKEILDSLYETKVPHDWPNMPPKIVPESMCEKPKGVVTTPKPKEVTTAEATTKGENVVTTTPKPGVATTKTQQTTKKANEVTTTKAKKVCPPKKTTLKPGVTTIKPQLTTNTVNETTTKPKQTTKAVNEATTTKPKKVCPPKKTTTKPGETTMKPKVTTKEASKGTTVKPKKVCPPKKTTPKPGETTTTAKTTTKATDKATTTKAKKVCPPKKTTIKPGVTTTKPELTTKAANIATTVKPKKVCPPKKTTTKPEVKTTKPVLTTKAANGVTTAKPKKVCPPKKTTPKSGVTPTTPKPTTKAANVATTSKPKKVCPPKKTTLKPEVKTTKPVLTTKAANGVTTAKPKKVCPPKKTTPKSVVTPTTTKPTTKAANVATTSKPKKVCPPKKTTLKPEVKTTKPVLTTKAANGVTTAKPKKVCPPKKTTPKSVVTPSTTPKPTTKAANVATTSKPKKVCPPKKTTLKPEVKTTKPVLTTKAANGVTTAKPKKVCPPKKTTPKSVVTPSTTPKPTTKAANVATTSKPKKVCPPKKTTLKPEVKTTKPVLTTKAANGVTTAKPKKVCPPKKTTPKSVVTPTTPKPTTKAANVATTSKPKKVCPPKKTTLKPEVKTTKPVLTTKKASVVTTAKPKRVCPPKKSTTKSGVTPTTPKPTTKAANVATTSKPKKVCPPKKTTLKPTTTTPKPTTTTPKPTTTKKLRVCPPKKTVSVKVTTSKPKRVCPPKKSTPAAA